MAGVTSKPYVVAIAATGVVVTVQIVRGSEPASQKASTFIALGVLALIVAGIGELSPELASGFAFLVLIAALVGGPNGLSAFKGFAQNLEKGATGS